MAWLTNLLNVTLTVLPRNHRCVWATYQEHGEHRVGTEIREKKQKKELFSVPLRVFSLISVFFG
jgi:hypothetical protein